MAQAWALERPSLQPLLTRLTAFDVTSLDVLPTEAGSSGGRPHHHVSADKASRVEPLYTLSMAVERQRPAPRLICRSDRDIQYAAEAYRSALAPSGITPLMSRRGDCRYNAQMESFFHTLKNERVHHRIYASRLEARRDLFGYVAGL